MQVQGSTLILGWQPRIEFNRSTPAYGSPRLKAGHLFCINAEMKAQAHTTGAISVIISYIWDKVRLEKGFFVSAVVMMLHFKN